MQNSSNGKLGSKRDCFYGIGHAFVSKRLFNIFNEYYELFGMCNELSTQKQPVCKKRRGTV